MEVNMTDFTVMAVKLNNRVQKAVDVQALFTEFGCNIKVRLGLHEAGDACSNQGLIILQLTGEKEELEKFEKKLNEIDGVKAKTITI
jgi:hypothetical protein